MPDDVTKVAGLPIPSISPFLNPQTKTNTIRSQELSAAAALPADHRDNACHHGGEADHDVEANHHQEEPRYRGYRESGHPWSRHLAFAWSRCPSSSIGDAVTSWSQGPARSKRPTISQYRALVTRCSASFSACGNSQHSGRGNAVPSRLSFDHSLARVQPLPAENLVQGCPQTVRKVIALGVAGVAVGLDISAKPTHRVSDERRSVSIDADEFSRLLKR